MARVPHVGSIFVDEAGRRMRLGARTAAIVTAALVGLLATIAASVLPDASPHDAHKRATGGPHGQPAPAARSTKGTAEPATKAQTTPAPSTPGPQQAIPLTAVPTVSTSTPTPRDPSAPARVSSNPLPGPEQPATSRPRRVASIPTGMVEGSRSPIVPTPSQPIQTPAPTPTAPTGTPTPTLPTTPTDPPPSATPSPSATPTPSATPSPTPTSEHPGGA